MEGVGYPKDPCWAQSCTIYMSMTFPLRSHMEMYLFSDDTTVYSTGNDPESGVDTLNNFLIELHSWRLQNKQRVRPGRCEAMFMMKSPFIGPVRPIMYGEDHIRIVQESPCLGLRIGIKLDMLAKFFQIIWAY